METKTAMGVAGGISLTVIGAVSALGLTFGAGSGTVEETSTNPPTIEYVDQYGNPIELEQAPSEVSQIAPEVVVDPSAETMMAAAEPQPLDQAPYEEYEEDDSEYEEHDDD